MAISRLSSGFKLDNDVCVDNRIVKAATEELLSDDLGCVSQDMMNLYRHWGSSGAGMIITGNMFVSSRGKCRRGNVTIRRESAFMHDFAQLAKHMQECGAKAIVQINHAGRQALRNAGVQPVAPSPIAVKGYGPMIRKPRALEDEEIEGIIGDFVNAAEVSHACGFDGVEVHAAHGYLLNQFLSPLTNQRRDRWGGALENRARPLLEVVRGIRQTVPKSFIIGVKLNSADFQRGGFSQEEATKVMEMLSDEGLQFLEISGGSYESPAMMGVGESTKRREAFFLDFAEIARHHTRVPLILTGGFRSARGMNDAIEQGHVDFVGLARPMIIEPHFPKRLLQDQEAVAETPRDRLGYKTLDNMLQNFWYKRHMDAIARSGQSLGAKASRWLALVLELPKTLI